MSSNTSVRLSRQPENFMIYFSSTSSFFRKQSLLMQNCLRIGDLELSQGDEIPHIIPRWVPSYFSITTLSDLRLNYCHRVGGWRWCSRDSVYHRDYDQNTLTSMLVKTILDVVNGEEVESMIINLEHIDRNRHNSCGCLRCLVWRLDGPLRSDNFHHSI